MSCWICKTLRTFGTRPFPGASATSSKIRCTMVQATGKCSTKCIETAWKGLCSELINELPRSACIFFVPSVLHNNSRWIGPPSTFKPKFFFDPTEMTNFGNSSRCSQCLLIVFLHNSFAGDQVVCSVLHFAPEHFCCVSEENSKKPTAHCLHLQAEFEAWFNQRTRGRPTSYQHAAFRTSCGTGSPGRAA